MNSFDIILDQSEPLQAVLGRASAEARRLTEELAVLDRVIGRVILSANAEEIPDLQQADAICQGLEGLSRFLTALAEATDPAVMCNPVLAARNVPMRAQAGRLAKGPLPVPGPEDELWDE